VRHFKVEELLREFLVSVLKHTQHRTGDRPGTWLRTPRITMHIWVASMTTATLPKMV